MTSEAPQTSLRLLENGSIAHENMEVQMTHPAMLRQPLVFLLGMALAACQPAATESPKAPLEPPTGAGSGKNSAAVSDADALSNLLAVYAHSAKPNWEDFNAVEGVTWTTPEKLENPDGHPQNGFNRSGKLLLAGFSETDLPNGKSGAEADYTRGNEGESGITLNGTADHVTSIAVRKFYPDTDYSKVLGNQFSQGTNRAIASNCKLAEGTTTGEANYSRNEFFQISLADGAIVFAEGMVDREGGKYSPGSTTYFFYADEPIERIDSMKCTRT